MDDAPVSLREVAEAAGVSRMSASRALRQGTVVSAELRARVEEAARTLGYRRDRMVSEVMTSFVRRRAPLFRETIAALWWEPWPELAAEGRDYWAETRRGLHEGATSHGCRIDDVLLPARNAAEALRRRFRARGVGGVILLPPPTAAAKVPELRWAELTVVALGSSLREPAVNRAQSHHYQAMERALAEVAARGYLRPVLLMQAAVEERARRAYQAAFLAWRGAERAGDVHPDARDTDAGLADWVKRRRADVVIAENDRLLAHVAKRLPIPDGVGAVSLDVAERGGATTGVFKNPRRVAMSAVDLLLQARWRKETGLPAGPQVLMTDGEWVEGTTLRARGGASGGS